MEEIKSIRGALLAVAPFFGSLLLKCSFVFDNNLQYPAANDGGKTIYINPNKFRKLEPRDRMFVLAHEAGHLAFLTAARRGGRDPFKWNISTDCVINHLLIKSKISLTEELERSIVTPRMIAKITDASVEDVEKMSADQIYNLLSTLTDSCGLVETKYCSHDEYAKEDGDGEGDIAEYWAKNIAEAYDFAKSMGREPAGLDIVLEILKPKVRWITLLRQAILQGPGLQVITTWKRPHRKVPNDLPGYTRLTVSNVWVLVDTSGSMVGEHLNQAMTEVFEIAKTLNSKVRLIAWDADAYEDTLSNIKTTMRVKGGGGTVIAPALKLLLSKMRRNDITVVLTDGLIFDIDSHETQKMLDEVAAKSAAAVFATTVKMPSLPERWRKVLIT